VRACAEIGIPNNSDYNGALQEGASLSHVNQKNGMRHSAADAFLKPALKRPNLTVITGARAGNIVFRGKRAVGVAYSTDDATQEARAAREVILCGGAINSPHLLLLSGIGPGRHLRDLGIPVVADVPGVGQNLQDHLMIASTYRCLQPVTLAGAESIGNLLNLVLFRRGMLTSNVGEALAFVRTRPELRAPDIELIFAPAFYMRHGYDNPQGHGFTIGAILLQPQSRGCIQLRSSNPADAPMIRANYLAAEADTHTLLAGVKMARRVAMADAFRAYRGEEVWPGATAQSDDDLLAHIRAHSETLYHPVGTCSMGKDALAVVNPRMQVHGVEGLRVADASIIPLIPRGHTNAAAVMIGERAAEFIKAAHRMTAPTSVA